MNGPQINRGFESMIPKKKPELEEKNYFNHHLRFKLFSKEFSITIKVNQET